MAHGATDTRYVGFSQLFCHNKYYIECGLSVICVQHAIATCTPVDAVSTWNCTSCPEVRVVLFVSGVDTIPTDGIVSTANKASTETALGTRHTAKCAEVRRVDSR